MLANLTMDAINVLQRTLSAFVSQKVLFSKFIVCAFEIFLIVFFQTPIFHHLVKPFLIRGPQNQTVVTGSSVVFQCRVGGEPLPDVLWRRTASGGNMPLGKLYFAVLFIIPYNIDNTICLLTVDLINFKYI
jgi:Immunoglobulin I-set domain